MFPIRDHNPSRRTPYVTWVLIAINVLVFVLTLPYYSDEARLVAYFDDFALVPARITAGDGYLTFLTSMFMHGGLMHLAGNMLFLWIFGDNLEDQFGHLPFLGFYLASGIGAGLAQYLASTVSTVPMVGASGAIAGVMGGYLLMFPRARVDVLIILIIIVRLVPMPAYVMLGFWFALQVGSGWVNYGVDGGGVAYLAHAGGFIVGLVLALPFWLRAGGPDFWSRTHGKPPHPETTANWRTSPVPTVRRRR